MQANVDELKTRVKKLNAQATQAKMDLHDLSEELPKSWEMIREVAERAHTAHAELAAARRALAEAAREKPLA
jgi:hypothetical protein